jgi:hypothetical protein
MTVAHYDIVVVGAGSGGIGAALAASRAGLDVLLIEKADTIGGTATRAGVSIWEMGAGGTGIPFEIYRWLKLIPQAVGIYTYGRHALWPRADEPRPFPGGESCIDPQRHYIDTLRRHGVRSMREDEALVREMWHGVPFEPEAYCRVVEQMMDETGHCTLLRGTALAGAKTANGRVTSLVLGDGMLISADFYIDSTGDAVLARACGCDVMIGQESKEAFGEPDAPDQAAQHLNGVTLIYRVTPTSVPRIEPLPGDVPNECWWRKTFPVTSVKHFPCGDRNMNMLPTMAGREAFDLGPEAAHAECRRRVLAHWHYNQTIMPEFRGYRMRWIAPALGVRESWRVVGEYVLTEHDLLVGLSGQRHDDVIAIADHAMDTHGQTTNRAGCGELSEPYGVPYRCLIPKGFDNLLVACRAASFSSLAASSCRLSRTMMQLGQAAGTAAAIAKQLSLTLPQVPPSGLRDALRRQHVQLEWPTPDELRAYLSSE